MTEDELREATAFGREQRGTEFKGPGKRTDKAFRAKVIRAVLGMANKPGGGTVVIGVADDGVSLHLTGLSEDELSTWSYDDFASNVSTYADPYVDFVLDIVELDGKQFVTIDVEPFKELPVVCKRSYQGVLRDGALYVRRRGKIETVDVPSHIEMREVLRRAAEFVARDMVASHQKLLEHAHRNEVDDKAFDESFDSEAEDLL